MQQVTSSSSSLALRAERRNAAASISRQSLPGVKQYQATRFRLSRHVDSRHVRGIRRDGEGHVSRADDKWMLAGYWRVVLDHNQASRIPWEPPPAPPGPDLDLRKGL